jgi:glycosyltransferase involved in cell wall biosynthesis
MLHDRFTLLHVRGEIVEINMDVVERGFSSRRMKRLVELAMKRLPWIRTRDNGSGCRVMVSEDVSMSTIAVNMMVLNGASVLRRCLLPLKGTVSEVVIVDTGSTDETLEVAVTTCHEIGAALKYAVLDTSTDEFFTDEAASFKLPMPGSFTERRIPRDWAAIRNHALAMTEADYVLKLDADDEPLCPGENWQRTARYLDAHPEISFVSTPYEIFDKGKLVKVEAYDRFFRRSSMKWQMACHEYVSGKTDANVLYTTSGLRVRDWRDSPGGGVRIEHRNLKVLLREWETGKGTTISTAEDIANDVTFRFTLAHEAAAIFPWLALKLLDHVVRHLGPGNIEMLSDCYYWRGVATEALGCRHIAAEQYRTAHATFSNLQALLKLHVLLVEAGNVQACNELRKKIVELDPPYRIPFNCDLVLLEQVRATM